MLLRLCDNRKVIMPFIIFVPLIHDEMSPKVEAVSYHLRLLGNEAGEVGR